MMSDNLTTEQVTVNIPNPGGKGGFADNPENINHGGRPKNVQRYDYWLQFFKDMKVADFELYLSSRSEGEMYLAESQAYKCMRSVAKDNKLWSIVADRTEGKAGQKINLNMQNEMQNQIQFVNFVPRPKVNNRQISGNGER